jgi:hypothetical protein
MVEKEIKDMTLVELNYKFMRCSFDQMCLMIQLREQIIYDLKKDIKDLRETVNRLVR